jgi:hypothetical protein
VNGTASDSLHFQGPTTPPAGVQRAVFQGMPQPPVYPELTTFASSPSTTFLLDSAGMSNISRAPPFKGTSLACGHNGAHLHFSNTGAPYTVPIHAPVAGTISSVTKCFANLKGGNDQVNISIAFAQHGGQTYDFNFTIEPMAGYLCSCQADGTGCGTPGLDNHHWWPYVHVAVGDTVNPGDVIADFPKVDNGGDGSHIHFDVQAEGGGTFGCPDIFSPAIVTDFGAHVGIETCSGTPFGAATLCYMPDPGEDPVNGL